MRRLDVCRMAVAASVMLAAVACGGSTSATKGATSNSAKGSTEGPGDGPTTTKPTGKGLVRSLDAGAGCYEFALVTGGLFAGCYLQPDAPSAQATPTLITYRGGQSLLPKGVDISAPWFGTSDGDLVALGRVRSTDPLAANPVGPTQLLVLQPPSATPKKTINLAGITTESVGPGGSTLGDTTFLQGLSATTAVISVRQNAQAAGAASPTQRLVAFDLDGTKRWDVPLPPGAGDPQVRVTGAGVLLSAEVRGSTNYLSLRRIGDGTPIWEATRPVGLPRVDQYGSDALSNIGRAVFYDAKGGVWSMATGASAGTGAPQDALTPNHGASYLDFATGVAATYQDDLIVSNPLRRVSPSGAVVWSLPGTTGVVASDGKVVLVLGRDALVAVDPGSGKTLAQAPTSPTGGDCGGTLHLLGRLAVVGSTCVKSDTTAYTIAL